MLFTQPKRGGERSRQQLAQAHPAALNPATEPLLALCSDRPGRKNPVRSSLEKCPQRARPGRFLDLHPDSPAAEAPDRQMEPSPQPRRAGHLNQVHPQLTSSAVGRFVQPFHPSQNQPTLGRSRRSDRIRDARQKRGPTIRAMVAPKSRRTHGAPESQTSQAAQKPPRRSDTKTRSSATPSRYPHNHYTQTYSGINRSGQKARFSRDHIAFPPSPAR